MSRLQPKGIFSDSSSATSRKKMAFVAALEVSLLGLIIASFVGYPPPDVNESHYLVKAKHFWDAQWCSRDLFLTSSSPHWLFYLCFGWMTAWLTLEQFAWVGRLLVWMGLAFSWRRLNLMIFGRPWISTVTICLYLFFNQHAQLSGEWVVGGLEAKSVAYIFVLVGLTYLVRGQWASVPLWMGLASGFHLLVGGWALLAAGFSFLLSRWRSNFQVKPGNRAENNFNWNQYCSWSWLLGVLMVVASGLPSLLADYQTETETRAAASEIYVLVRLPHHLDFRSFPVANMARFGWLVTVAISCSIYLIARIKTDEAWRNLFWFVIASLLFILPGVTLSAVLEQSAESPAWATSLLRFYWFRLADFAIPLLAALSLAKIGVASFGSLRLKRKNQIAIALLICLYLSLLILFRGNYRDQRPMADQRSLPKFVDDQKNQRYYQNWRQVCQWIKENTPAESLFITPHQQQTFKWYAQRAEVVNWKDIPQDAVAMVEWKSRVDRLILPQQRYELGLLSFSDQQILEIAADYEADYLVVPQWQAQRLEGTALTQVYPENQHQKTTFVVYQLSPMNLVKEQLDRGILFINF